MANASDCDLTITYRVKTDPQYHVILEAAKHGDRWPDAREKALNRIATLRAEGAREDWQLLLCQFFLITTSESTYADDLAHYKAELEKANHTQPDRAISPEAMSDGVSAQHLSALRDGVGDYFSECLMNNGQTGPPPNELVLWGLRSTDTGRWIRNTDSRGVEALQIFRTDELARAFHTPAALWCGCIVRIGGGKSWTPHRPGIRVMWSSWPT